MRCLWSIMGFIGVLFVYLCVGCDWCIVVCTSGWATLLCLLCDSGVCLWVQCCFFMSYWFRLLVALGLVSCLAILLGIWGFCCDCGLGLCWIVV